MKTLALGQKNWNCPYKIEARQTTIIDLYRAIFGQTNLPADQQYWTLCGEMSYNGFINPGCELDQIISSGLILPSQFHGIELNEDIYKTNISAINNSNIKANIYHGEFSDVIDNKLGEDTFNPGIIYLDTIQEPKGSVSLLAKTLDVVNQTRCPSMIVWNFIKEHKQRGRYYSWEDVEKITHQNTLFKTVSENWKNHDLAFQYNGTGKHSATTMGTVVLYRQ